MKAPAPPEVYQEVWYIGENGNRSKGIIMKAGTAEDPLCVGTIWFEHPDGTPGKLKHVHNVHHESQAPKKRCWREKS